MKARGSALVADCEGLFFSNGLDIGWAGTYRGHLREFTNAPPQAVACEGMSAPCESE
jgi:hypothetical protein